MIGFAILACIAIIGLSLYIDCSKANEDAALRHAAASIIEIHPNILEEKQFTISVPLKRSDYPSEIRWDHHVEDINRLPEGSYVLKITGDSSPYQFNMLDSDGIVVAQGPVAIPN